MKKGKRVNGSIILLVMMVLLINGCSSPKQEQVANDVQETKVEQEVEKEAEQEQEGTPEPENITEEVQLEDDAESEIDEDMDIDAMYDGEKLTPYGVFYLCQENELVPYLLNEKATSFLKDYPDAFPTDDFEKIDSLINYELEYKHISKNPAKHGSEMMALALQVVEIGEEEIDEITFSVINGIDENGQQYYIIYMNEIPDVFAGDVIAAAGLPLGTSSFLNTDGGQTLVVVLAGSYIEKLEE